MIELRDACAGNWTAVLQSLGIDAKYLSGRHTRCLICDGVNWIGRGRGRWDRRREIYFCSGCGHKHPITLAMQYLNLPFKEIANLIRPRARDLKMTPITPIDTKVNEKRLLKIHGGLQHLHSGNAAGLYLIRRGLAEPPKQNVYYHPGYPYYEQGEKLGLFPVMVSRFQTATGDTATYHLTYLNADGQKAAVPCPKKFLPTVHELAGGAIRLAETKEILGISEGIETGIAAMIAEGIPVWVAGSACLMEKIHIPESVQTVMIFVDEDRTFTGQKAAYTLAHRLTVADRKEVIMARIGTVDDRPMLQLEKGLGLDYLDYALLQNNAAITALATEFGPLKSVETTLAGVK